MHEYGYFVLTGLDADGTPLRGPTRWRFASPAGRPIVDHRTTLSRYLEQLTLMPDPADTG